MPRFFTDMIDETNVYISGDDAKHIAKSLRMQKGEQLEANDLNGTDYLCEIESITDIVTAKIIKSYPNLSEPNCRITLFQALPKGDKLDLIIQKAVELGVYEIIPVVTQRCISRPDQKSFTKKLERYKKISLEAAKQCGRGYIPKIGELQTFNKALELMKNSEEQLFFYEKGGEKLSNLKLSNKKSIAIMVGSEGGFSEEEWHKTAEIDIKTASLGARILRCETAPMAAISVIMYITDNF